MLMRWLYSFYYRKTIFGHLSGSLRGHGRWSTSGIRVPRHPRNPGRWSTTGIRAPGGIHAILAMGKRPSPAPNFSPNRDSATSLKGSKKLNLYFGKVFFQLACRIILGPPKHVLHLVWSCLDTYLALKTTLKVSLYSYLNPSNSGQIMNINTGNLFVFEVGPSVKFVSAIIDAIFNKKN